MPNYTRRRKAKTGLVRHRLDRAGYRPKISQSYFEAREGEQSQSGDIAPEAVDGDSHILHGSLASRELFASTIVPPEVLSSLPALPDEAYPVGVLVFDTSDGKLYRNVADVWTAEVDGADIAANSITAGQIAAGAIGVSELAADSVEADKIAAGAVDTEHLAADAITADKIAAGAITAGKVASNAIHVTHILDPSENVIPNGGFEDTSARAEDTVGAWGWAISSGQPQDFNAGASNARSGSRKLRIEHDSDTTTHKTAWTTDLIPVSEGARYTIKCWLAGSVSNSTTLNAQIRVFRYLADGSLSSSFAVANPTVPANNTYQEVAVVHAPPSGIAYVRLAIRLLNTAGASLDQMNVDDVEMYRADTDISHAAGDVLINGSGVAITNGKITVTNAGATVIIDGTSNMFKIAATGTTSNTIAAGGGGVQSNWTDVTVTGPFTSTPAHLSYIATTTGNAAPRTLGRLFTHSALAGPSIGIATVMDVSTLLSGSNCLVRFGGHNAQGSSQTWYCKYYILKEAAL